MSKTRSSNGVKFVNGDLVFFKRKDEHRWKGPATVIGQDGQQVILKHGGYIVRVHPCRVLLKTDFDSNSYERGPTSLDNLDINNENDKNEGVVPDTAIDELETDTDEEDDEADPSNLVPESGEALDENIMNDTSNLVPESEEALDQNMMNGTVPRRSTRISKKINYKDLHEGKIHDEVFVNHVEDDVVLLVDESKEKLISEAKDKELNNLKANSVYTSVDYNGQALISCKWVLTEKNTDESVVVKARLVARGFEEQSKVEDTESPTCGKEALRLVFLTAATKSWQMQSIDISSAFLQGNELTRDVYLKPPTGFEEKGKVWKLNRCIYGLNDAPRAWYEKVKGVMINLKGQLSKYDNSLFIWHQLCDKEKVFTGIIALHVDDFKFCGTSSWEEAVIRPLCDTFKISSRNRMSFRYVGINVNQTKRGIVIDQNHYIQKVEEVDIDGRRDKDEQLTPEEITSLKSLSGQLLWAATQTRPDIAVDACVVANYGKSPTVRSLLLANKAVRKLKSRSGTIMYPNLGDPKSWEILVYTDASHGNLPSGASQGGCIIFITGNGNVAPFHWQSKKLPRVAKSSLAAETQSIAESGDMASFAAEMIKEVFAIESPPVKILTDSKSFIDHLATKNIISDKRMRIDMARIREMLSLNEIEVGFVPTDKQLADPLTKIGASVVQLRTVLQTGKL